MNFPILQTINLQKDNDVLEYKQGLNYGDNKAHEWLVTIKNGESTEVDLDSVAVTGYFLRADHVSVRVPGTIKNGVCSVVLDKRCYLVEGRVSAVMVLSRGEEIVTSAKMRTYAEQNITDQIIDTGDTIPTDIYDLLAQIDAMKEATKSTVAATTSANAAAERANAAAKRAEDLQIDANGLAGNALKLGGQLPEYYANQEQLSQLSEQMAALQSGVEIVPTVSGNVVALDDASNLPLRGLVIHGKTTQNGTPTPDNPVELVTAENPTVRVAEKNLWPFGNMTGTAGNNVLDKAELALPAGSYTISANVSYPGEKKDWTIGFSDKNGVSITSVTFASGNVFTLSRTSATVTLYARCEATFNNIQIEHGRSATGYEPYSGQNLAFSNVTSLPGIPVTSGGNYTDASGQQWICDEIDLERGAKTQRIIRHVQTVASSSFSDGVSGAGFNYFDFKGFIWNENYPTQIMCDHFALPSGTTPNDSIDDVSDRGWNSPTPCVAPKIIDGARYERVYSKPFDGTIVFLMRATEPIVTQLTESELAAYRALVTNKPNTTIYNDAGCDQTVRYVADTQIYIDNRLAAIAAVSLEG